MTMNFVVCTIERRGPLFAHLTHRFRGVQEIQRHSSECEQIRILLERQREQILGDCQAEIQKHEFQADYDKRSIQKLNEMIESQKEEICRALQRVERLRQDHQLLHEQLLEQNWDLREAHERSLGEMEEVNRFQGSTFDTIARGRLVVDRDTILELTATIQELQIEVSCLNDSRDFVRWDNSTFLVNLRFSPPFLDPGGMPSRNDRSPSIWDTHGKSGNFFANPTASSSAPYPQDSNHWVYLCIRTHITTCDE